MGMVDEGFSKERREFIQHAAVGAAAFAVGSRLLSPGAVLALEGGPALSALTAVVITNPLASYPQRDWEATYRNLEAPDSQFHFLCAPNDTHNCLLRAFVKNGVIVRIGPSYGYGKATDIYGNQSTARWDPRCCKKGLSLMRRVHGNRRVTRPMIRQGFKRWVDDGFPRQSDGLPDPSYLKRGQEPFVALSWDDAYTYAAKALKNLAETYQGSGGRALLAQQGYEPEMLDAMHEAGTQALKFRGGMPFLGATRIIGMYRYANAMALLDANVRGVLPAAAYGGRGWDNYAWHTDLPPGHTLVTGQQTIDFDLALVENSEVVTLWGMNWIVTKMPDSHWLTEARLKGTKVIVIACEYQATANKADEVVLIRPGTDTALALGVANIMVRDNTYDAAFVKNFTDLPLLVRTDTRQLLRASEVVPGYTDAALTKTRVYAPTDTVPKPGEHREQWLPQALRTKWGDYCVWDLTGGAPAAVSRDEVGADFASKGLDPALAGTFTVSLVAGGTADVRPLFAVLAEHLANSYAPADVEAITGATAATVEAMAAELALHKGKTFYITGMGPNHFFNNDLKDRAVYLIACLTANIGLTTGNIGSYAGNYRGAFFNGLPTYAAEDPFNLLTDPLTQTVRVKKYYKEESAHYYNYGDRPLKVGTKMFTGTTHMPTPTKSIHVSNSNSLIGNAKWHYEVVMNTFKRIECVMVNEWWWTGSCEYADIVFGVDSWAEFKIPDFTAAVSNPFFQLYPATPLARQHDTKGDIEVYAGVCRKLAELTGDMRFVDMWKFVHDGRVDVYLQRIIDNSSTLKGYDFDTLHENAKQGIPALLMTRTTPKSLGYEQIHDNLPWYTKTGRLEFYREEPEFLNYGENLPVHREPVDGTPYEPNVIVARAHAFIQPEAPTAYGKAWSDLSAEDRQVRNRVVAPDALASTAHPLKAQSFTHVFITPKYRHGAHTTPIDLDMVALWFGPFGDIYRHDKRMPWVGEGYVDLNPADARALGIEDGDYIWLDGDPQDRPYRGWTAASTEYKVARCKLRARYYPGLLPGVALSWFHMYGATYGSVEGHETNPDKLARNPRTNYQAMFRYGSHQSATRAWLRPTMSTDSVARKTYFGQTVGEGYEMDVNTVTGAPKESFVKLTRAEDGDPAGGLWRPARLGYRPGYETAAFLQFLRGEFVEKV